MLFKRLSRSSSQQRDTTGFLQTCLTESGGFLPREALCRCSRGFAPEPREWGPQLRPDPPTVTGTCARAPPGTEPAPPRPPRARIVPGRATKGKPDHLNPGVLFPPPGEFLPSGARKQKSKKTNGAVGRGQTEPGRGGGGRNGPPESARDQLGGSPGRHCSRRSRLDSRSPGTEFKVCSISL